MSFNVLGVDLCFGLFYFTCLCMWENILSACVYTVICIHVSSCTHAPAVLNTLLLNGFWLQSVYIAPQANSSSMPIIFTSYVGYTHYNPPIEYNMPTCCSVYRCMYMNNAPVTVLNSLFPASPISSCVKCKCTLTCTVYIYFCVHGIHACDIC